MGDSSWLTGGKPFRGKRIDKKGNVLHKGDLLVASHELQFILSKSSKKLQRPKEEYPFNRIKSYGCHENVLSIKLGGGDQADEVIHFKLKEAIVVKEIMDQVIRMKKKPTPRMPSFDSGFYDMKPGASQGNVGTPLHRKLSLQENMNYSSARTPAPQAVLQRSYSTDSTGSSLSSGPPSAGLNPGYDNPGFMSESNVMYVQVEKHGGGVGGGGDVFSPPPHSPQKKKFPMTKSKSAVAKFGYSTLDIEVMEVLQENVLRKQGLPKDGGGASHE